MIEREEKYANEWIGENTPEIPEVPGREVTSETFSLMTSGRDCALAGSGR